MVALAHNAHDLPVPIYPALQEQFTRSRILPGGQLPLVAAFSSHTVHGKHCDWPADQTSEKQCITSVSDNVFCAKHAKDTERKFIEKIGEIFVFSYSSQVEIATDHHDHTKSYQSSIITGAQNQRFI
jgi:hypothetical protein